MCCFLEANAATSRDVMKMERTIVMRLVEVTRIYDVHVMLANGALTNHTQTSKW